MTSDTSKPSPAATIRAEVECWWSGSSEHEIDQITDSIIKGLGIAGYVIVPARLEITQEVPRVD